jgi:hypothetical protein
MTTINLGNLKFTWKGDWSPSTLYNKDDIVKYGGSSYVCTDSHTSDTLFATNASKFDLMAEGISNAGVWSTNTLYQLNEVVTYGGAVYIALRENQNANPYTSSSDWQKFVDGQQFEGDYDVAVDYQKGDIVYYGGYLYVATQNTTNNNPTNGAYWNVLIKGYEYAGVYNPSVQYKPGDVVEYGGNRYVCNEGQRPLDVLPTDAAAFTKILDGFKYQGDWVVDTGFAPGDLTKYGSKIYRALTEVVGETPDTSENFELFIDSIKWLGAYSDNNSYIVGDVVRLNGRTYICIESYENDGSTTPKPPNTDYWQVFTDGMSWQSAWDISTEYEVNDVVEYAQSSYISMVADNIGVTPGTDANTWQLVAQGDSNAVLTTQGDIIFRDATQTTRLGIGPAGSTLVSNGSEPTWGHLTPQNDYYVSPQGDDTNDGRTPVTSWRTIKHACEQTFSLGQIRINVSAGVYEEQCPIRVGRSVVLEGNGLGAVTVSPNTTADEGFGVGISDDGSTPNANSYVFHMNNGARMRNFVFRGFSTGSVLVSLDPGTGPDDTSVWITSQSPYVQNCTSFTPGGTGFKIDGSLHNGGYKSMVANDWTQINSDGIGIHALNDGRSEIVSCFTYYCDIGYLAESGAKIRAIVGNNSYGEYGAVARGYSQLETPLTANLRLSTATINSVQTLSSDVHVFTSYRDSVGNRFMVGHTNPTGTDVTSTFDNTASNPFIAKFNSAGSLDWIYTYENSFGAIHSAVELSDRIYCGGVIYDGSTNKGFILSISKAGEIQWSSTIGDTSEIVDVTTDENNLYAVGTHTTTGGTVIKLNPAGVEQWSRTLEYSGNSNTLIPSSCCFAVPPTTSTDTYTLAGDATAEDNLYVASYDTTASQAVITRISDLGEYVESYEYGDIRINTLRLDSGNGDGIYLVAGGYYDAGAVNKVPLLFRLSVDGTVQWQKQIAVSSEEGEIKDVLPFGNDIYVSGYINQSTNTYNTGLVARFSSTGVEDWIEKIDNGTNNISLNGILLDGVNVVAAGIEQGNSVIISIQRDLSGNLGTITTGSYSNTNYTYSITDNTVVSASASSIAQSTVALGTVDITLSLNQQPTQARAIAGTRSGFAGIGTGVLFSVDNLSRSPKEGSVLQIAGDDETYFVIAVDNFLSGAGTANIQIDPALPSNKTPNDNTGLTFREAFSQVRMSGHDFLDVGTGGFADTNYPVIIAEDYSQKPNQSRETLAESGGRVFYVTTDQDGNFRVGDYFKVEQATGRATLSSEEFDLAGLNELQLGSITAGKQGATINEFSTDGTFADNSDSAVPTEKAVKTYVDQEINQLSATQGTIVAGIDPTQSKVEVSGSGLTTDKVLVDIAGATILEIAEQFILVPKGGTADRPGVAESGQLRFNTDTNTFEGYDGTQWSGIGGGNPWTTKTVADTGFTAANNDRYFIDTTGGPITVVLPNTPAVGDQIRIVDVATNFATQNCVLDPNGLKINNQLNSVSVDQDDAAFTIAYSGATYGWKFLEV